MLVKNQNNKNKGQVLVLVAVFLLFVGLPILALAIDVAYFYHTKHQLQGAADAAALAGAQELSKDETLISQPDVIAKAELFASNNTAANEPVKDADVEIAFWNGSECITEGITLVNAVKVTTNRVGERNGIGTGAVGTFFGRIFGVEKVDIHATACAARIKAEVFPIVANEYWMATDNFSQRPYGNNQLYPNSFVRKTTVNNRDVDGNIICTCVNGNETCCSNAWDHTTNTGKVFGILGTNSNSNAMGGGKDANSYVNLDVRSSLYYGTGNSWFLVKTGLPPAASNCSSELNCRNSIFTSYTGQTFNPGFVNSAKFEESLRYLHEGYDYALPTAIKEKYIPSGNYPPDPLIVADNIYPNSASDCPFATIAYFSTSGGNAVTKKYDGKSWDERFPKGKKIVILVYDGTYPKNPSDPNAITIVGYTLAQIDGYASSAPKGLDFTNLNTSGNTAYAHALLPIVEPTSGPGLPGICDPNYPKGVNDLMIAGATYRLVQ